MVLTKLYSFGNSNNHFTSQNYPLAMDTPHTHTQYVSEQVRYLFEPSAWHGRSEIMIIMITKKYINVILVLQCTDAYYHINQRGNPYCGRVLETLLNDTIVDIFNESRSVYIPAFYVWAIFSNWKYIKRWYKENRLINVWHRAHYA